MHLQGESCENLSQDGCSLEKLREFLCTTRGGRIPFYNFFTHVSTHSTHKEG